MVSMFVCGRISVHTRLITPTTPTLGSIYRIVIATRHQNRRSNHRSEVLTAYSRIESFPRRFDRLILIIRTY